jgi:hypothetical protein
MRAQTLPTQAPMDILAAQPERSQDAGSSTPSLRDSGRNDGGVVGRGRAFRGGKVSKLVRIVIVLTRCCNF